MNNNIVQIEFQWTRDVVLDLPDGSWEVRPRKPSGKGWIITDASRDRRTRWRRIRRLGGALTERAA
jgi:hypothetical protein